MDNAVSIDSCSQRESTPQPAAGVRTPTFHRRGFAREFFEEIV